MRNDFLTPLKNLNGQYTGVKKQQKNIGTIKKSLADIINIIT